VTFQILAEGPGAAVGAGGRYDGLLGLFGAPRPAAGFAVALDHLSWALGESSARSAPRVLVSGDARVLSALRALGVSATEAPREIWEHARAWHFSHVLTLGAGSARLERVVDRAGSDLPWAEPAALAASVAQALGKERNS